MPETMTGAELFGNTTKTANELFGSEQLDPAKITGGDIPNGDKILDKKPSYKRIYDDILTGRQDWDNFIPAEKRAILRETMPTYEEDGKRLINSAYLADLTGMDINETYVTHDQLAETILKEKTPTRAFDRIKNRYNNGRVQVQIMDLGYNALTGKIDPAVALERIGKLKTQLTSDYREDLRGFGEKMVGATAEQLPNMWEGIKASPVGAGGGAIIGALVAAIVGNVGPQAATPEEATTIPAAAGFGAKIGGGVAAANRIRELEAGGMYLELLEMKDANGNTIDPSIAATTAHIVGVINGGLELAEWAVILETFGVGTTVFEKASAKVTESLIAKGTLKQIVAKYSLKYGASLTTEVLQEISQESTNIVMGELAKELNNELKGTDIKHISKEELLDRYYEVTTESIKGFALLVAPGTIFSAAKETATRKTRAAKLTQTVTPQTGPVEEQVFMEGMGARLSTISTRAGTIMEGTKKYEQALTQVDKSQQENIKQIYKKDVATLAEGMQEDISKIQRHYQSIAGILEENKESLPELVKIQELLPDYAEAIKSFLKSPAEDSFAKMKELENKIRSYSTTYGERISKEKRKEIARGIEGVVATATPQEAVDYVYEAPDVDIIEGGGKKITAGSVPRSDLSSTLKEIGDTPTTYKIDNSKVTLERNSSGEVTIHRIEVEPKYRKKGEARKILQKLADWADENNETLNMTILPDIETDELYEGLRKIAKEAGFIPDVIEGEVYRNDLTRKPEKQDVELTAQETADLAQLDALEAEEDLYELKRVPKELRGKGVGYVIVEKATGKEAAKIADRTQAKAKLSELNKAGKPIAKRKPPRDLLTGKSTIGKVVEEYTALKAAFKKAAQAARKAFIAGRTEGIIKTKQHYADLKAREKARKALKDRIAKAVKTIKKSPPKTVDYFYRRLIEELQDRIDPKFRTKRTLARRQAMREFLQRATPEEQADFPDKLAALLDKKPLNELTVEELENVAEEIKRLTKLGKVKLKARKAIEQAQFEKTVNRLTENADAVPTAPEAPKGIDYTRTGLRDAIKNAYVWTLRIPRLMDWLDGRLGTFKGFWHETFYNSVNRQTDAELRMAEQRHQVGMDKMKELGITMNNLADIDDYSTIQNGLHLSKEQQMGVYAALKNQLSLDALVNGNKIKMEVANAIISNLDQKYKDLTDFIIDEYQDNYSRIRDVYVKLTNEDLGKEEFYTPIIRLEQNEHVAQQEVIDQLLERHGLKKGYVEKKFTINRKNISPEHQKPMDLRLISVWQSQVQKQEHFIHFSELVKNLRKIVTDSTIRTMIESKLGKQGKKVIDNYISRVANPDIYRAYDGLAGVSRQLRRNVAMSYLAFNVMTIAKQAPSAVLYLKDAGPSALFSSIWEFAQHPREIWNLVREKDPQVKHAFIERELEELRRQLPYIKDADTVGKINKMIATVGNKGMIGIRYMDGIARSIGWYAVYQKNLQLGLSEAEAVVEAQNATLRTQPAASPKDLAQLYATDEYLNWFTMFTNQLNNIWNITTYDMFAYWSNKNYQDSAMTLFSVGTNALILWMLLNKRLPEDEEDLADAALDQSLNMLPLINGGAMVGKRGWGTLTPPPLQAVTDIGRIYSAKDKEKQAINALKSSLVLTGIPVNAIRRAYRTIETGEPGQLLGGQKKSERIKF